MRKIFIAILIIISTDIYSQRIPFGFWSNPRVDTLELEAPLLMSPADDTTGMAQSPLLDWDGVIYATGYIVQLSDTSIFTSIAWSDTTGNSKATVELGLTRGSDWYWRVKAYNIFDTSEWSTTFHFTVTTGPALTTPVLVYPGEYATGIPFNPVLDWDSVINADYYKVDISASTNFSSLYWSDTVYTTTATVGTALNGSTQYYWRVIAQNPFESKSSDTGSFTTHAPALAAPTLVTPANAATGQSQSPTLVWRRVTNADFYSVQLTQYDDFSSILLNVNTFDTSKLVAMTLLEGTKWYWRIRAINSTDTGSWSSTYSFAVTEGSATARAYYVDPESGKDEYNGRSAATPYSTLSKISSKTIIAGDTVLLKGGSIFAGMINTTLTFNDTVNKVIFNSYGTGKATIDMGSTDSIGVYVNFTQHVNLEIKNLIINGDFNTTTQTGGDSLNYGIAVVSTSTISPLSSNKRSFIRIHNCQISNIWGYGIAITPYDYGKTFVCTIDSNTVYNIGRAGISMNFNWHSGSVIRDNLVHDICGLSVDNWNQAINISICKGVTVTRNVMYHLGQHSIISGMGVQASGKSVTVSHNEIYGIYNNSGTDGEGIDFENGADSCIAEFNYIHDSQGMGILISSLSSQNSITNNYKTYATDRGSIDSGSADYNVIRYNVIKDVHTAANLMGIKCASGLTKPSSPGRNNQIYNNTIISNTNTGWGIDIRGRQDSTKVFNNIIAGDYTLYSIIDTVSTKVGAVFNNNVYWNRRRSAGSFQFSANGSFYSNIQTYNTATGLEATKYAYNPLTNNAYSTYGDTLNSAYNFDTVTKYIPVDGSLMINNGLDITRYTISAPSLDIRGEMVYQNSAYDIGAYEVSSTSAYGYTAESKRWFGRMDTVQTASQMKVKDSLITFLKADTLYTRFDLFYVLANLDTTSAKLNVLKDTFNITAVGSPTFTTQQGYTGATSKYLSTGYTPSSSATLFKRDSGNISAYCLTNVAESNVLFGTGAAATYGIWLVPNTGANLIQGALNSTGINTTANSSTIGLFTLNRTNFNTVQFYKNDTMLATKTDTSITLSTSPLTILAYNGNGIISNYTTRKVSIITAGGKLNEYNHYRLKDNLDWYLNSVGATTVTPLKPRLLAPANTEDSVSVADTLDWATLNNSRTYHLQIDDNSDFSSLTGEVTGLTRSQYIVGGSNPGATGSATLDSNTTYYWRVRAVNPNGNSSWSNTFSFSTPNRYLTESTNLFARFDNGVSGIARKDLIDSLIRFLKADTVWQNLDAFYMFAAEDTAQANVNWVSSSFRCVRTGTTKPTHARDTGYTSDASTGYLNTQFAPSAGTNYTLNSASYGIYSRTNAQTGYDMGSGNAGVNFSRFKSRDGSDLTLGSINENLTVSGSTTNSKGLFVFNRNSSTTSQIYKNGTSLATGTNTSTGRSTVPFFIFCTNANGSASTFSTHQIAVAFAGASMSSYRQWQFNRRIEWFLNRLASVATVPSAPVLITPATGVDSVAISPAFDWDDVGANYYQIEIDNDIAFGTPEYSANISGSQLDYEAVGDLSSNTLYYWRVRGVNSIGTGAWATTFSFTTMP